MRTLLTIGAAALLTACNGSSQRTSAPKPPPQTEAAKPAAAPSEPAASSDLPSAGGIRWNAPALFVRRTPTSSMRAAEYVVEGQQQGDASLTVFFFGPGQGGDVTSNVNRWVNQFESPKGGDEVEPDIAKRTISGLEVTRVDVSGTYKPSPMMQAAASTEPQRDQRMLAAIVQGRQGPVFFKLIGPAKTVALAETAFEALLNSIHSAP